LPGARICEIMFTLKDDFSFAMICIVAAVRCGTELVYRATNMTKMKMKKKNAIARDALRKRFEHTTIVNQVYDQLSVCFGLFLGSIRSRIQA